MDNNAYQYTGGPSYNSPDTMSKGTKVIVIVGIIIASAIAAGVIIGAIITRQRTGVLEVKTSSKNAIIYIQPANKKQETIGKGSTKLRLTPGNYQVTASENGAETEAPVTITKKQAASVDLSISPLVTNTTVTASPAQNIYFDNAKTLYFLQTSGQILYTYPLGGASPRPYLSGIVNGLTQVYWVNPTEFFGQSGTAWKHYKNGTVTVVGFKAPATVNTLSANAAGQYSYVDSSNNTVYTDASGNASIIDQTKGTATMTSISPNGTVAVFAPRVNFSDKTEPSRLYHNGTTTQLPDKLTGIGNVRWSPDSSKFSYSTNDGMFVYDIASDTTSRFLAGNATNPFSVSWLNNNQIIYGNNRAVWTYEVGKKTTRKVASFEGTLNSIQPFVVAPDGQTVYYGSSADADKKGGKLYAVVPNYNSLPKSQQQSLKSQQQSISVKDQPVFYDTNKLLNYGITNDQVQNLRFALSKFATTLSTGAKKISIYNINAISHDPNSTTTFDTVTFAVSVDGTVYDGSMDYSELVTVHVTLKNGTGATVFDSGIVSSKNPAN
jgi:hypothetical protein